MDVLKVSSRSNPNSCAGALAGVISHEGMAEMQVVGAGALNQAVKAIAIARGFLVSSGLDLVCVPMFADIEIDGQSRTAIRLLVEDRDHRHPPAAVVAAGALAGARSDRHAGEGDGAVATRQEPARAERAVLPTGTGSTDAILLADVLP